MKTVCVYCSSSSSIKPLFFEQTKRLGELLADEKLVTVCGAGSKGLMAQLSDSILQAGGKIIGIIPKFMYDLQWSHSSLSELIVVNSMHERKQMMANMADAIIALPGGCGTMEELLEIITWKQLNLYQGLIIILNIDGYYNHLVSLLNLAISEKFMAEEHLKIWNVVNTPEDAIKLLKLNH